MQPRDRPAEHHSVGKLVSAAFFLQISWQCSCRTGRYQFCSIRSASGLVWNHQTLDSAALAAQCNPYLILSPDPLFLQEVKETDSGQPDSTAAPSSRPRSASFDEGSLATLFYPPLPEDHQTSSTKAPSTALPIRGKLWTGMDAASMDAEDAEACSSPMAIKAHHGAHGEQVTTDTGVASDAARCRGALPLWESPVRRRPHGDSSGSLASTPPPRGPIKFPSYREGRLSVSRAGALLGGPVSSQICSSTQVALVSND